MHPPREEVLASMHKVWVKSMVFANTGENHRVSNSVFNFTRIRGHTLSMHAGLGGGGSKKAEKLHAYLMYGPLDEVLVLGNIGVL